jgi:hypothetical protein
MRVNFKTWFESQPNFDDWLGSNLNMKMRDFAEIGDTWLPSNTFEKDGAENGEKSSRLPNLTAYKVFVNKDGTVYKFVDASVADERDKDSPKEPYGNVTHKRGKEYLLTKDEYQKLALFPKLPQQPAPGGAPGGMPPPPM